jgi:hypothetical protein
MKAGVPGAVGAYDLPDLAALVAPRPLLIVNATDQLGQSASAEMLEEETLIIKAAFASASASDALEIREWPYYRNYQRELHEIDEVFADWLTSSTR